MVVKGIIENIVFQNKENGYTVAVIDCNKEAITLVGKMPAVFEGQAISATGHFVSNARFGEQFAVDTYELIEPSTEDEIVRYLSSGLIHGIGPVTARRIVEKFGENTLEVIEMNPLKLKSVKGVSLSKAVEIGKTFMEIKKMQDAIMFLQKYNISNNLAMRIFDVYGESTKNIVQHNPYKLVEDIRGVGFKTADKIAQSLGIAHDSGFRVRAGLVHVLNESSDKDGNTYMPKSQALVHLGELLELDFTEQEELFQRVITELVLDGILKEPKFMDVDCLMLSKYFTLEMRVASKLYNLKMNSPKLELDIERDIEQFETFNKVKFHKDQKRAIEMAVNQGVCVITGGPGTGKTTIIKCIMRILQNQRKSIALLAPTGRAAKRMSESCGADASTIHRALMIDFSKGRPRDDNEMFLFNDQNKLPNDVIIVDEVSMVDVSLMSNLLSAIKPDAKLIMVGDKNQLPSVGAGNVLADIIGSGTVECCELTYIYRQSESSLIVSNAHLINAGKMPVIDNSSRDFFFEKRAEPTDILRTLLDLISSRVPKFLGIDAGKIQVLAPMRAGICGVDNLNSNIQKILNPEKFDKPQLQVGDVTFRLGDKVMQIVNNYTLEWKRQNGPRWEEGEAVFNGDIGAVSGINLVQGTVEVTFEDGRVANYGKGELNQLVLSYAITIHKSQGSEFDVVLLPIIGGSRAMLTRNLLYTAVTRAKRMVVLVGKMFHLKLMVENDYTAARYSALGIFLKEIKQKMEIFEK